MNIVEGEDEYVIEVAAPGLEKKDFKIDLENNHLTISSEKEGILMVTIPKKEFAKIKPARQIEIS